MKKVFLLFTVLLISVCLYGCRLSRSNKNPNSTVTLFNASYTMQDEEKIMDDINKPDTLFRVNGTQIIGPGGKEFVIKGVNVNGPGWAFSRDTLQDVEKIVDVWQFNTVRLCAATRWDSWARHHNSDLDALVDAFTKRGIVVMLELHDYTGIYPPLEDDGGYVLPNTDIIRPLRDLIAWWVDKAERFKDNHYVWFNIMNEPGNDDSKESAEMWYYVHDVVIKAIRDAGADNIIVLDDHGFGQASGYRGGINSYASAVMKMGPALNEKYNNLVFSLHVYEAWTDGYNRFHRYFDDAENLGLCIILGEYGVLRNSVGLHNAVMNMFNAAIPRNIGRIYWAWDDRALPLTESESGCGWDIDRTDGTMPGNLTWVGELVWLDNRGLLEAPVPAFVLDLPLLSNGDFENGMDSWQNWGGSSVVDGVSYNGSRALVVSSGAPGGSGQSLFLKANTTYTLSVWGRGAGDVGVKYRLDEDDPFEHHNIISFSNNDWVQKTISFTTPSELFGPMFFIWKDSASAVLYLDDIVLSD
jgi:hypothetical protein